MEHKIITESFISGGTPEYQIKLEEAGYKILNQPETDGGGLTTFLVLANVHPSSLPFAIQEIKDILFPYTLVSHNKIEVKPTSDSRVLAVGFWGAQGKDYIKEFNEDQERKKLPINFQTHDDWGHEEPDSFPQHIKYAGNGQQEPPIDNEKSFPAETVSLNEVKNMVAEAVLEYMNADINVPTDYNLLDEQKVEIKQKIEEGCKRQGIMSISFHDDFDKNEATVNLLIDPTNRNNWIALKEEQIYKVPYSYKIALYEYASEIWKNNIK